MSAAVVCLCGVYEFVERDVCVCGLFFGRSVGVNGVGRLDSSVGRASD